MAIESILPKNQTTIKEIKASEITTSYTILTNVVPTTTAKLDIRTVPSSSIQTAVSSTTPANKIITIPLNIQRQMKNVKVVPPSQFIQIKQSAAANASKVFTLKPSPAVNQLSNAPLQYTVRAQPPTEIRQFKPSTLTPLKIGTGSGPQILSSVQIKPPQTSTPIALNSTKFTIVNQVSTAPPAQINKIITTSGATTTNKLDSDLSTTDIFDIPILFADNDGNIQENDTAVTVPPEVTIPPPTQPVVAPIVISPPQTNRIIVTGTNNAIKTTTLSTPTLNKMVIVNRSGQMKPVTTSPGSLRSMPPLKYTRVLVSTPSSSPLSAINKGDLTIVSPTTTATTQPIFKQTSFLPGSKVEIVNNKIVKTSPNPTTITTSAAMPTPVTTKYKPIVINVDSDKTTVKNIIRVGDTQIKAPNTIVLKPATKTFPILNSGILNHRNLTVRKVVNLIPQKQQASSTTTITPPAAPTPTTAVVSAAAAVATTTASDVQMMVVPTSSAAE